MRPLLQPSRQAREIKFSQLAIITLIATYGLILIGSAVRASGAGMGCPDWPTCFGMLIPPLSEQQLPIDYHLIYGEGAFNPRKTWTEFGNRMASLVVGLLMLSCLVYALRYLRYQRSLLTVLFGMLGLTAFQAWLGSIVVASYLHPLVVSSHMVLALAVIVCLHTLVQMATPAIRLTSTVHLRWLFICGMALLLQIGLGLQVREEVDALTLTSLSPRENWIQQLGGKFILHRLFSMLVVGLAGYTIYSLWNDVSLRLQAMPWLAWWCIGLLSSLVTGTAMWLFDLPAFLQPLHLFGASLQLGMVWHLLILFLRSQSPIATKRQTAK